MTKIVAQNITGNGDTAPIQIEEGQHFFAVGGNFDGATVQVMVNVGPAKAVPVTDAAYTAPGSEILWLPACTLFLRVSGVATACDINAALAEVSTKLD